MPRAKKLDADKAAKESISGPKFLIAAAKIAARCPTYPLSPWVMEALEAKLRKENPGLIERVQADLAFAKEELPLVAEEQAKYGANQTAPRVVAPSYLRQKSKTVVEKANTA